MPDPIPSTILEPADSQIVDLGDMPVIKQKTSRADLGLTEHEYRALQSGIGVPSKADLPGEIHGPAHAAPPAPAPAASPVSAPAVQALPVEGGAPVTPRDTPGVRDRIRELYRARKEAESESQELRGALAQVQQELAYLRAASTNPHTAVPQQNTNPYSFEPPSTPQSTPAGDYLTRAQAQEMFRSANAELARAVQLGQAQSASRLEAQRQFPDVFASPELLAAAEDAYRLDPQLQGHPNGPFMAAALVRSLSVPAAGSHTPGLPLAQVGALDALKRQAAGIGSTVTTPPAQPNPSDQAYAAAVARAKASGRIEDWATVRRIATYGA